MPILALPPREAPGSRLAALTRLATGMVVPDIIGWQNRKPNRRQSLGLNIRFCEKPAGLSAITRAKILGRRLEKRRFR
jgi:hypothetical protein